MNLLRSILFVLLVGLASLSCTSTGEVDWRKSALALEESARTLDGLASIREAEERDPGSLRQVAEYLRVAAEGAMAIHDGGGDLEFWAGLDEALEALQPLLKDADPEVREIALVAQSAIGVLRVANG